MDYGHWDRQKGGKSQHTVDRPYNRCPTLEIPIPEMEF